MGITSSELIVTIHGEETTLEISDIPGNKKNKYNAEFRGIRFAIVLYDITRAESLLEAEEYLKDISKLTSDGPSLVLVGNKSDLSSSQQQDGRKR